MRRFLALITVLACAGCLPTSEESTATGGASTTSAQATAGSGSPEPAVPSVSDASPATDAEEPGEDPQWPPTGTAVDTTAYDAQLGDGTIYFSSPTGNITCEVSPDSLGEGAGAMCEISDYSFETQDADCEAGAFLPNVARLIASDRASMGVCSGGVLMPDDAPALDYGRSLSVAGVTCVSESSSPVHPESREVMACYADATLRGFRLSVEAMDFY